MFENVLRNIFGPQMEEVVEELWGGGTAFWVAS
jgi:hypothetical protein